MFGWLRLAFDAAPSLGDVSDTACSHVLVSDLVFCLVEQAPRQPGGCKRLAACIISNPSWPLALLSPDGLKASPPSSSAIFVFSVARAVLFVCDVSTQ